MSKHVLVVFSNVVPGKEDEYNEWYTNQHLDDVLRVPGFTAAQRYKVTLDQGAPLPGPYLALYEMECDDPEVAFAGLDKALQAGEMPLSPGLDVARTYTSVFTPISDRKVAKKK